MTLIPLPPRDLSAEDGADTSDVGSPANTLVWTLAEPLRSIHTHDHLKRLLGVVHELWTEDDPARPDELIERIEFSVQLALRVDMGARETLLLILAMQDLEYFKDSEDSVFALEDFLHPGAFRFAVAFDGGRGLCKKEHFFAVCDEMLSEIDGKRYKTQAERRPRRLRALVDQYLVEDNEVSIEMFQEALWACLWHLPLAKFAKPFERSRWIMREQSDLRLALDEADAKARAHAEVIHGEFTARDADGEGGSHLS